MRLATLALSLGLVTLSTTACQTQERSAKAEPDTQLINQPRLMGNLTHPELSEVSGLAASTRTTNVLWAINDSGNSAKLYAFDHQGRSLASFKTSVSNRDWEDMASAWINGESYLLVGDIGDNLVNKADNTIHVFVEPILDNKATSTLTPIHTLRYRYPDRAHDSESLAFADGWIYILSKETSRDGRRQPSQVYRLPLDLNGLDPDHVYVAQNISALAIPPNTIEASLIASLSGVDVSQPTAFDIDAQNRHAYVLTYRNVYRYTRESDKSWADVLAQPRTRVHTHSLSQAEALTVSDNGTVWFTSEKRPAPLWALPKAP